MNNIKHRRLLLVAAGIDLIIGIFLFACSMLEFFGVLQTQAHNVTRTIGVNVSYLIFLSAVLLILTGGLGVWNNKYITMINTQIVLGVLSLAWPLFLQISLLFTQFTVNIRLLVSILISLFFMVAVLIVKIANAEYIKRYSFNPAKMIMLSGKRKKIADIPMPLNLAKRPSHNKNLAQTIGVFASNFARKRQGKPGFINFIITKLGSFRLFPRHTGTKLKQRTLRLLSIKPRKIGRRPRRIRRRRRF